MWFLTYVVWAALVLLRAGSVAAFELERVDDNPCGASQNLHWLSAAAAVDTGDLQPVAFADRANEAAARWNESTGRFRFNTGFGGFCNFDDGVVSMGFSDTACGRAFGDVIALTITRFNRSTGQFADANVIFNINQPALLNQDVFRQVAMHELGHVLGLDHSDACGDSGVGTLMRATIDLSAPRLVQPQADDIAGANFIYGGESPPIGGEHPAPSSCAIRSSASAGTSAPALFLLALAALRRVRKRGQIYFSLDRGLKNAGISGCENRSVPFFGRGAETRRRAASFQDPTRGADSSPTSASASGEVRRGPVSTGESSKEAAVAKPRQPALFTCAAGRATPRWPDSRPPSPARPAIP